ncbi:MAG: 6-bladed beta-propeller [Acidobacteriota bacterium]
MERIVKDGVEVVVNHLEPYKIGNKRSFTLEEIFKINTEETEIANLGIADIRGFEVNSLGEIFILRTISGEGDFVFKFDRNGGFVKSFGPQGQGPGEIQIPHHIALDSEDNILVTDSGRRILLKYDKEGVFIKDYEMKRGKIVVTSGPQKNLLVLENLFDPETRKQLFFLKLLNSDFEEINVIDKFTFEMPREMKFRATEPLFCWSTSHDNIYVAKEDRGYEIWVYDFNGKLRCKIHKEYRKISISENYKTKILNSFPEGMRNMAYFPEFHPPFQSLVAGDSGMLLVPTFEEGNNPREFLCDIFNEEGVFIGRKSLNVYVWEGHLWAHIKANKFYCLKEKDSGYKEFVVYDMKWE